jgi:hypothetical protein
MLQSRPLSLRVVAAAESPYAVPSFISYEILKLSRLS